ncbi:TetR/AcrR family transcriptional regulator [Mycoplasmatota bacterium]|nr:TetR/AcrR family transcriptional regulator [Mycoplasmatota bacterium]
MNEKKRIHILETAMILFNQHGFDSTPTSKIAKKAKISVGTLFNYFPTKTELIQAIYVEVKIHSRKTFLMNLKENASEHDNLLSMWRAVIHWGVEYPEEFKYLEMFSNSPYINNFKDEKTLETYQKFRESILDALSPTSLCSEYPEYLLMYIDNALHAATRYIIYHQHIHNIEGFINQSFDLIWHGFAKK